MVMISVPFSFFLFPLSFFVFHSCILWEESGTERDRGEAGRPGRAGNNTEKDNVKSKKEKMERGNEQ